jgi:hypothetical protein
MMKSLCALLFALFILTIGGCSDQKRTADADKKDHLLRQQMDVLHDAENVTGTINQKIKTQDEEAAQIAGH